MTPSPTLWYHADMNTLIRNVAIIPMNEPDFVFTGDIGISAGKISFLGEKPNDFTPDNVIPR